MPEQPIYKRDIALEAAYEYIFENSDELAHDALEMYYDYYSDLFYEKFKNDGMIKDDY